MDCYLHAITAEGNGPKLSLGDNAELLSEEIKIYSKKGGIEMSEDTEIWGKSVKLNPKKDQPTKDSETGETKTKPLKVKLTDADFEPIARKHYVLFAEGQRLEGETGGDGGIDVEITAENVPGLSVASDGALTVALDITLTEDLISEGIARELVSRIQTLRKETGLEITDRIALHIERNGDARFAQAVGAHAGYILSETLSVTPESQLLVDKIMASDDQTPPAARRWFHRSRS